MRYYERALRYLWRKKIKTVLLFLVLLVVSTMILAATVVCNAMQEAEHSMQAKSGTKIRMEILNPDNSLKADELDKIKTVDGVRDINAIARNAAYPVNFYPAISSGSESEENQQVSLLSYNDWEKDSAFEEQRYRLVEGSFDQKKEKNGILINFSLAEQNDLSIGDSLELESVDGKTASGIITGFFVSGTERQQDKDISSVNRIENQIYVSDEWMKALYGESGYEIAAVYTSEPGKLCELEQTLSEVFSEKAELTSSDVLYRQMKAPLEQISKTAGLMRLLAVITGAVVITLLLCMWRKEREKEGAVFISIGETKSSLLLQSILEAAIVFLAAVISSCTATRLFSGKLQKVIGTAADMSGTVNMNIEPEAVLVLAGVGGLIILAAIIISMVPVYRTNPKDILAKMEG